MDVYEPYLIMRGFLQRTPRGRIAHAVGLRATAASTAAGARPARSSSSPPGGRCGTARRRRRRSSAAVQQAPPARRRLRRRRRGAIIGVVETILLHACCGPCSTVAVPALSRRGPRASGASSPTPTSSRPTSTSAACSAMRASPPRSVSSWSSTAAPACTSGRRGRAGPAPCPPAGRPTRERCRACLEVRLDEAARATAARGLGRFSTSLSVSPWQHHDLIARAGLAAAEAAGVEFVYADLRALLPAQHRREPAPRPVSPALLRLRRGQVGGLARAPRARARPPRVTRGRRPR